MDLIILIILILIVIFSIVAFINIKKSGEVDYYTFFVVGLIWIPFGILASNKTFILFGAGFFITGLVNKENWRTRDFSELPVNVKRMRVALILFLIFAFLIALGVFFGYLGVNI
jgi:hypothetical protein